MQLEEIIKLTKAKNQQAEKMLFVRFAPFVLTLCRRYASQNVEAKDFMQECFIHVFAKINVFDASKGKFEAWLSRVCTNRILQLLRKSKKEVVIVFPEELPEQTLSETAFQTIPREVIMAAIQTLPAGYREVFNLYIFEKWSHKEIGSALEISETTSRSQLSRAKKLLQVVLKDKIDTRYERRLA